MYSILLVDDEKSIREYLPKAIPFDRYGFFVKDTAVNGEEALQKLPKVCPDLILLDVRMPIMDGLQFSRQLRQGEFSNTPVIMLSGYSDFEYAKEAMKYGVKAYLNKPLDEDEIIPMLDLIHEELDEYRNEKDIGTIRKHLKTLNSLYNGGFEDRRQFSGYTFMTCVLLPCSHNAESSNPHFIMQECLTGQLGELENYQFRAKGSQYTFLLPRKILETFKCNKESFSEHLLRILGRENLNCSLLFDSYIFENEENSFREDFSNHSYEMLTDLFFYGKKFMDYYPGKYKIGGELQLEAKYMDEIKQHLSTIDKPGIMQDIEKLTTEIQKTHMGIHYIQEISYRIYYLIVDEISHIAEIKQRELILSRPEWLDYPYFISFDKWKEMLYSLIMEGFTFIERSCRMESLGICKEIIEYIHLHYMEKINLKQIADKFFVNAAYLGRVFQKTTGANFKQYINHIRINEAKKLLLQTNKLVYEIAHRVGYTDSKYFIVKFTQEVGKSPTEYRNQM